MPFGSWQDFRLYDRRKQKAINMKKNLKNILGVFTFLGVMGIFASGCVEHRYYHEHHYHTAGWYHHRNQTPPPGVDINIHN
jgi:hypothetical protein